MGKKKSYKRPPRPAAAAASAARQNEDRAQDANANFPSPAPAPTPRRSRRAARKLAGCTPSAYRRTSARAAAQGHIYSSAVFRTQNTKDTKDTGKSDTAGTPAVTKVAGKGDTAGKPVTTKDAGKSDTAGKPVVTYDTGNVVCSGNYPLPSQRLISGYARGTVNSLHAGLSSLQIDDTVSSSSSNEANNTDNMAPFRDEHILIIVPGSQTTLAQLGIPESMCPPKLRIPTRMFPGQQMGQWEATKIREKVKKSTGKQPQRDVDGDEPMTDVHANGVTDEAEEEEEHVYFEEDPMSDEGAVYPIVKGRIVNHSCFFAFLTHVHNTLSPPLHTPILMVGDPAWTIQDYCILAQFCFERFSTPAIVMEDAAPAISYTFNTLTSCVIDVGYEKCSITAVVDSGVEFVGRITQLKHSGGKAMTERLLEQLGPKGFTFDMCEQLKKSSICEVMLPGTELPKEEDAAPKQDSITAAAATTGALGPSTNGTAHEMKDAPAEHGLPRGPGPGTEVGEADQSAKGDEDNDGVLDIASIVASGKTNEFLAKKEKEKAEKAAARRGQAAAAAAERARNLPNSQKAKATFTYTRRRTPEEVQELQKNAAIAEAQAKAAQASQTEGSAVATATAADTQHGGAPAADSAERPKTPEPMSAIDGGADNQALSRKEERRRKQDMYQRQEIEVGTERFRCADEVIQRIGDAVHRCILGTDEIGKRPEIWNNLIVVGNGSKVKGFKEALSKYITDKYLISPSTETIFTSEIPSTFTTPAPTGANTPQPQPFPSHHGSGVNPLLVAATHASNQNLAVPGQQLQAQLQHHHQQQQMSHHHAQTPTSIKTIKVPDNFSEWKEHGYEEAVFLGAQIGARICFIADPHPDKMYLTRQLYNEKGPRAIRRCIAGFTAPGELGGF